MMIGGNIHKDDGKIVVWCMILYVYSEYLNFFIIYVTGYVSHINPQNIKSGTLTV